MAPPTPDIGQRGKGSRTARRTCTILEQEHGGVLQVIDEQTEPCVRFAYAPVLLSPVLVGPAATKFCHIGSTADFPARNRPPREVVGRATRTWIVNLSEPMLASTVERSGRGHGRIRFRLSAPEPPSLNGVGAHPFHPLKTRLRIARHAMLASSTTSVMST
jgi:hypothetical protein